MLLQEGLNIRNLGQQKKNICSIVSEIIFTLSIYKSQKFCNQIFKATCFTIDLCSHRNHVELFLSQDLGSRITTFHISQRKGILTLKILF